ncbi:hypothetical protein SH2C18_04640 [Clostridium sediminicola]|uniref:DUF2953 domain-containing protein n=1 Tax=Clostridium sediminicola TaxID=3114879 RepID=UPI0031F238B7
MKVLIIVLLILIIPLPLIFDLTYNYNSNFILKINGFNIKSFGFVNKKSKKQKKRIVIKPSNNVERLKLVRKLLFTSQFSYYKPIVFIKLNNEYGFGDPAITGISYGAINYIVSQLLVLFNNFFHLKISKINIVPIWNKKKIEVKLNLFFICNILNIIIFILILLNYVIKYKRENKKKEG